MIIAELLTVARLQHLYYLNSATWDTTSLKKVTCPAGKRWFILYGVAQPSVAATLSVTIYNPLDQPMGSLTYAAAGTTQSSFPTTLNAYINPTSLIVLDPGDYVSYIFGAAQGATAYCSLTVLEIDMT